MIIVVLIDFCVFYDLYDFIIAFFDLKKQPWSNFQGIKSCLANSDKCSPREENLFRNIRVPRARARIILQEGFPMLVVSWRTLIRIS